MKKYSALVKDKTSKQFIFLENKEYNCIDDFKSDIKANGCYVYKNRITLSNKYSEKYLNK